MYVKAKNKSNLRISRKNQIKLKILNLTLPCDANIYHKYYNLPVPVATKMLEMNLVIP
jgi:hypothetical protein